MNRRTAQAQGRSLGRQWIGDPAVYERARQLRLGDGTVSSIARESGISRRTLGRATSGSRFGCPMPTSCKRT